MKKGNQFYFSDPNCCHLQLYSGFWKRASSNTIISNARLSAMCGANDECQLHVKDRYFVAKEEKLKGLIDLEKRSGRSGLTSVRIIKLALRTSTAGTSSSSAAIFIFNPTSTFSGSFGSGGSKEAFGILARLPAAALGFGISGRQRIEDAQARGGGGRRTIGDGTTLSWLGAQRMSEIDDPNQTNGTNQGVRSLAQGQNNHRQCKYFSKSLFFSSTSARHLVP